MDLERNEAFRKQLEKAAIEAGNPGVYYVFVVLVDEHESTPETFSTVVTSMPENPPLRTFKACCVSVFGPVGRAFEKAGC